MIPDFWLRKLKKQFLWRNTKEAVWDKDSGTVC
jgi:hypothetical protein